MLKKILKKTITLGEVLISHLSMLSIRSKKIYVFGSWKGNKFSDNPKYLYLEAVKDSTIIPVWITRNKEIYRSMKSRGLRAYMYNSLQGIYYQLRASVYFTCMSRQDVLSLIMGNATRINLWHGVAFKKIMNDDKISPKHYGSNKMTSDLWKALNYLPRRKEYIVSTSEKISEIYRSAFGKKKENILQLGQPRTDIFFSNDFELEQLPFRNSVKKIILYMPTHRNEGRKQMALDRILDLDTLNRFCAQHNILFLIKKHYYHIRETEQLAAYEHIIDITQKDLDTQQLLKCADILVTDYSSCFIDYLLLDRPIVFYNYDYDQYVISDRDMYFDYDSTTPGPKAKNFQELIASLQSIVQRGNDNFMENRKAVRDIFYSADSQRKVSRQILDYVKTRILN
jgi:CDP-glycerol glycerophosphotransferase (TagB/SpsB family)